jgi:4-amino-4-deoxychorismate lyase
VKPSSPPKTAPSSEPLPLDDRGVAYGHGLFETMQLVDGTAPLLEQHIQRAQAGLCQLLLTVDEPTLRGWFASAVAASAGFSGVLKVIITAGSGGAGYAAPAHYSPRCRYTLQAVPAGVAEQRRDGIALWRCAYRLPINPPLAGVKHLNRLDQLLARAEWQERQYAEGLVCSAEGDIVEATAANIFIRAAHGWVTPRIDRCGVRGVMRDYLLGELFPALGWPVTECPITESDLAGAGEIFVCNAVRGIVPVVGLNSGEQWPIGTQTRRLQERLAAAVGGYEWESSSAE